MSQFMPRTKSKGTQGGGVPEFDLSRSDQPISSTRRKKRLRGRKTSMRNPKQQQEKEEEEEDR
jgi:hypothetical protein